MLRNFSYIFVFFSDIFKRKNPYNPCVYLRLSAFRGILAGIPKALCAISLVNAVYRDVLTASSDFGKLCLRMPNITLRSCHCVARPSKIRRKAARGMLTDFFPILSCPARNIDKSVSSHQWPVTSRLFLVTANW